jgi:tRNA A37 methylthiotransferase MiaB
MADVVCGEEKTARIVALQALQREIQTRLHEGLVGTTVDVLVDSAGRRRPRTGTGDDTQVSGRTSGNTVVNFPVPAGPEGAEAWIGRTVPVTIRRAGPNSLWGVAVSGWMVSGQMATV